MIISLLSSPRPPRCLFRPRLGEGRVRGSRKTAGQDGRIFGVLSSCLAVVFVCGSHGAGAAGMQSPHPAAKEVAAAVRTFVMEETPWLESEIEIRSLGNLDSLEVPPGGELRIAPKAGLSHSRNHLLPLEIVVEGNVVRTTWIKAEIVVKAEILQAAKKLPYGMTLSAGDAALLPAEITNLRGSYFRNLEEAAGQAVRRALSPGDPLTREALTSPVLVRSGETVRLTLEQGGVRLSVLARAEQSGKIGQVIRVRTLDYMRPLRAQVVGPGLVSLQESDSRS